jgi:hypothetical protein
VRKIEVKSPFAAKVGLETPKPQENNEWMVSRRRRGK